MNVLAIETSAKAASVALVRDGVLVGEYFQNSGQTHSRTMMKMAEDLLENCEMAVKDLSAVAVAMGPGSFTGVRIGMAAAKGLCWGAQLPLYGVSTLEAMARGFGPTDYAVVPVMDARRSQVYCAGFVWEGETLRRILPDCAISMEALAVEMKKWGKEKILVGDGSELCYNTLSNDEKGLHLVPEHLRQQRASGVALTAIEKIKAGEPADPALLVPQYLRLSQAERERLEKENLSDRKENHNG